MQLERKPHPFMPTRAEGHDPNVCAAKDCGKVWNSINHQPSRYLDALTPEFVDPLGTPDEVEAHRLTVSEAVRKLSGATGVPEGLLVIEKSSGPPLVVSGGTPPGQPQPMERGGITTELHDCDSADTHPAHLWQPGVRTEWFTCTGNQTAERVECEYCDNTYSLDLIAAHIRNRHATMQLRPEPIDVMQSNDSGPVLIPALRPLTSGERVDALDPDAWTTAPLPRVFEDYCNHPNGFGPMGCPCGASASGEDDPITFRHIPTGEDEITLDCPTCFQLVPESVMADHLRQTHPLEWPKGRIHEFLEGHALNDKPETEWGPNPACKAARHGVDCPADCDQDSVPYPLKRSDDLRANLTEQAARFFDAAVPTEELTGVDTVRLEQQLNEWWMALAEEESRTVVPKAVAYGSNSLLQLGRKMAQLKGRTVSDEEAMELGCWVYAVGKIERWTDAVMRGERPSDDSIYDLGIYVKMVQRIRDVGSWPGV